MYVTEGYTTKILGLDYEENRELVAELSAHAVQPRFQYQHSWQAGDLLMWDNCAIQHKATFDYPPHQRRLMHRTTLLT